MNRFLIAILSLAISFVVFGDMAVSTASQNQTNPKAVGKSGRAFVAWNDTRAGTGNMNIYGHIVRADGTLEGTEKAICVDGSQQYSVATSAGAKFVAAWVDERNGDLPDIYARQVNDDGTTPLAEFRVTTTTLTKQNTAMGNLGNDILIAFEEVGATYRKIRGHRLAWSGTQYAPTGSTFDISGNYNAWQPAVCGGSTDFLVAWADTNVGAIICQRVSTTGTLVGDTAILCDYSYPYYPQRPAIAWNGSQWLVVWHVYVFGSDMNVYGRFVNSAGDAVGSIINIATGTHAESFPDVEWDGIGFLVVWQDTRLAYANLYGKRILGGTPGAEEAISTGSFNENFPSIAWTGSFHDIFWQDFRGTYNWDIYTVRKSQTPWNGPTATAIRPPDGGASSCPRQQAVMYLYDSDGINTSTIKFTANGTQYTIGSQLTYSNDTLRFTPSADWPTHTWITCTLDSARDMTGLNIASPVSWQFMIDRTNPYWGNEIPDSGSTVSGGAITLSTEVFDAHSGVSTDSMGFQVFGIWYYHGSSPAVTWDGTNMRFNSSLAGVAFDPFATYTVCARARDRAMYCTPNQIQRCWNFSTIGNRIYGNVNLSGTSDNSGVTVQARYGDSLWSATTNTAGNYSIAGVMSVSGIKVTAFKTGYSDSTVTVNLPSGGSALVNFTLYPIVVIYSSDFEANDGGLNDDLRYGFYYDWEWGIPTSGPGNAHSGSKCWATKLNEDYSDSSRSRLKTQALVLPSGTAPFITWWQWYRFQAPTTGGGGVRSWHDGGNVKLWRSLTDSVLLVPDKNYDTTMSTYNLFIPRQRAYADTGRGNYWHRVKIDLSAYAGQTIYISWDFGSSARNTQSGWFIDDVVVGYVNTTAIDENTKPDEVSLKVFPNPFNSECRIISTGPVDIFDINGRKVIRLDVDADDSASRSFVWDGRDSAGNELPSGIYFVRLANSGSSATARLILMR